MADIAFVQHVSGANDSQPGFQGGADADAPVAASSSLRAGWQLAHERLVAFARTSAVREWEEGRLLRAAFIAGAHARLGFGSFVEYVERLFGYNGRQTREKLRVADALDGLPKLSSAFCKNGGLTWSAVRELSRVVTPATEAEWIDAAQGRTARDVEELVAGRRVGDRPSDCPDPRLRRHVLRFEVSAETRALFAQAMAKQRRDSGGGLDDDGALLLMARSALGGPSREGRASYQVELTICERCRRGEQLGDGVRREVRDEIVDMCECDAQHLGVMRAGEGDTDQLPKAARAEAAEGGRDHSAKAQRVDGRSSSGLAKAQRVDGRSSSGSAKAKRVDGRSSSASSGSEVLGAVPTDGPDSVRLTRATQTIPPALRRRVMRRDSGRCAVTGCRHATWVDVHHIVPRAAGGRHELDNLVCLCGAHHRAVHERRLVIDGRPSTGLKFLHANGGRYGDVVSAHAAKHGRAPSGYASVAPVPGGAEVEQRVSGALKGLGFAPPEIRWALERCRDAGFVDATPEVTLRRALELLGERGRKTTA